MRSLTIRFRSPVARLIARYAWYMAIVGGLWFANQVTEAAPPAFVYQGF